MKNKLIVILAILSIALSGMFLRACSSYNKLQNEYSLSLANNKAYLSQLDTVKNKSNVFQFQAELLSYLNDSIVTKLKLVQTQLGIKDKNLQELYYLSSRSSKTDTIELKGDTLFRDRFISVDTIIGDKWYTMNLKLKYPSTIITTPSFLSEKYLIASYKKECIDTPSKWWIKRIFLKKHKIITVDIVEKNPYIVTELKRFIQIVE